MFNPDKATMLPPRIERLEMRLHPPEYTIEHIAGKWNVEYSPSGLPLAVTEDNEFIDTYMERVFSIIKSKIPAMTIDGIRKDAEKVMH